MSVKSWFDKLGEDLVVGFEKVEPKVEGATVALLNAEKPLISTLDPFMLPAITSALNTITQLQAAGVAAVDASTGEPNSQVVSNVATAIEPIINAAYGTSGAVVNVEAFVNGLIAAVNAIKLNTTATTTAVPVTATKTVTPVATVVPTQVTNASL